MHLTAADMQQLCGLHDTQSVCPPDFLNGFEAIQFFLRLVIKDMATPSALGVFEASLTSNVELDHSQKGECRTSEAACGRFAFVSDRGFPCQSTLLHHCCRRRCPASSALVHLAFHISGRPSGMKAATRPHMLRYLDRAPCNIHRRLNCENTKELEIIPKAI